MISELSYLFKHVKYRRDSEQCLSFRIMAYYGGAPMIEEEFT